MSTPENSKSVIKRGYLTVVEGVELANEFARSRLTASEFARQRGLTPRMLSYWNSRARALAAANAPDLVQVATIDRHGDIAPMDQKPPATAPPDVSTPSRALSRPSLPSTPPVIEVRMPNGVRIGIGAGFSPDVLKQVVACLGNQPC